MLRQLFGFGRNPNQTTIDALYGAIVAAARQQELYSVWRVPDTPLGRFEMLSLHVFLTLHRLRGGEKTAADVGQDLTDEFFRDIDHSLREIGIGDMGIPRRMKKLAQMFYGRARAYGAALEAGDRENLAAALKRNVMPERSVWEEARPLADYVFEANELLAAQPLAGILSGAIRFPTPQVPHGTEVTR